MYRTPNVKRESVARARRIAPSSGIASLWLLLVVADFIPSAALAQSARHIIVTAISPLQQTLNFGQRAPEPLVARVTDDTGAGVAGVSLAFHHAP